MPRLEHPHLIRRGISWACLGQRQAISLACELEIVSQQSWSAGHFHRTCVSMLISPRSRIHIMRLSSMSDKSTIVRVHLPLHVIAKHSTNTCRLLTYLPTVVNRACIDYSAILEQRET